MVDVDSEVTCQNCNMLQRRIQRLEAERRAVFGIGGRLARVTIWFLFSPSLVTSLERWIESTNSGRFPSRETAEVLAAIARRLIRVGLITCVLGSIPIAFLFWQNLLIQAQLNEQKNVNQIEQRPKLLDNLYNVECALDASTRHLRGSLYLVPRICMPVSRIRSESAAAFIAIERQRRIRPDLAGANLENAILVGADLSETILVLTNFVSANLHGADFSGANLSGADFGFANLTDAQGLSGPMPSSFAGATLDRVDLSAIDFQGVTDIRGARLENAILPDVDLPVFCYSHDTVWPEGYRIPPNACPIDPGGDVPYR